MHLELILRAVFLVDFAVQWGLGWRYLMSREFRRRVHQRWATQSAGTVAADAVFAMIAFVVLNGFIVLVGMWLYQGIVVPRLAHVS